MMLLSFLLSRSQAPNYVSANLGLFAILSKTGFLPWEVDVGGYTVTPTKSSVKRLIFFLLTIYHAVHTLHFIVTLILSFFLPGKLKIVALPMHVTYVGTHAASIFFAYEYCFKHFDLTPTVLNEMHGLAKVWPTLPKEVKGLTLQNALLGMFPYGAAAGLSLAYLLSIADPTLMLHWYYLYDPSGTLPSTSRDWMVYAASCLGLLTSVILVGSMYVCVYLNLVAFEYFTAMAVKQLDALRLARTQKMRNYIRQFRQYQLALHQYNVCNADALFYIKQFHVYGTVLGTFAAIKFFERNAFVGAFSLILSLYAMLLFVIGYEKAFSSSEKADRLKRKIRSVAEKSMAVALYKCELLAIRNEGVQVGSFGCMEKISTLQFIQFCSTTVASLLISFRSV